MRECVRRVLILMNARAPSLVREVRIALAPALHRRVRKRMEAEGRSWGELTTKLLTEWLETIPPDGTNPR